MRSVKLAVIAATAALPLILVPGARADGRTAAAGGTARATGPDTIAWGVCTDAGRPAARTTRPQCGKLTVPLDYADPSGPTVEIALVRVQATGPGRRLGSLVFNFGGPGGSGVDALPQLAGDYAALGARYDLVSFDPRGVERSSGVRCGTSATIARLTSLDFQPDDAAERAHMHRTVGEFAAACRKTSGAVLPHVGTVDAAADLERLRRALGEERLNYFGISYGTHLGAVYASRFPERVGRFVLDAPLDPRLSFRRQTLDQAAGFQQAYEAFLKDCVTKKTGACALGSGRTAADRKVRALVNRLDAAPMKVGDRRLTDGLATTGIMAALYAEEAWPVLEQALDTAARGDGRLLLAMADEYTGRKPDGSYSTLMGGFSAVSCADTSERPTPAQLAGIVTAAHKVSPLFGGALEGTVCSAWPVAGDDEAAKIDATGSDPILVIATTGDPATPYRWGTSLARQLGTAVLVTFEGGGHGAYGADACVTRSADAYLLDGKVPAKDTVCPGS
ncbi:alpha/beta fold hydrolase [Planomonospora sp. ID67723]|uniref:alpha/beta hydrolase n=1 Tax=Planomonospora sp. ID67723 TaxID=2738134 RepID=UPI0018C3D171|nr:alpha/beta hydrolase [Planomonospora sp. ID67723]MBG0827773.1 alpha/beta fold hydrolase [Planomonospora sp. ID67723]